MKFPVRLRTHALVLSAAVVAASLAMTGTSLASTSPARTAPGSTAPSRTAPAGTKTLTEYVQEMSTSPTSPKSQVVAYGAFTASGVDTMLSFTSTGPVDKLSFPGGTFIVTSTLTSAHQHTDPGTCVSTLVLKFTYKIGKGTGQFAGITGSGHATNTEVTLAARTAHGGCSTTKATAQQSLIEASGPVTLK
jgi:hypothetical protein